MQRYVVVLANENGQVVEPSQNIATKVATLQNSKPSRRTPRRSRKSSKKSQAAKAPSIDANALSDAVTTVAPIAANLLGDDNETSENLVQTQDQNGVDPLGLLADAAPAIGGAIGSIVPGVGTALGAGVGAAVSFAAKLLD